MLNLTSNNYDIWIIHNADVNKLIKSLATCPDSNLTIATTHISLIELWLGSFSNLLPYDKIVVQKLSFLESDISKKRVLANETPLKTMSCIQMISSDYDVIEAPPFVSPIAQSLTDWTIPSRHLNATLHFFGQKPLMLFISNLDSFFNRCKSSEEMEIQLDAALIEKSVNIAQEYKEIFDKARKATSRMVF